MTHVAVSIGVPDEADATDLSRELVERRLAAGTRIVSGTSHYRWEGSVEERTYWTVRAFTTEDLVDEIQDVVAEFTMDDLPGVTWTDIEAEEAYLDWIDEQTK